MAATTDTTHTAREEARGAKPAPEAATGEAGEAKPDAPRSAGLKAWLPLIISVVTMPVLAFATTRFVLLPKMEHALGKSTGEAAPDATAESTGSASKAEGQGGAQGKTKVLVPMGKKILVNVAGTMGTRYLMTGVTLVGNTPDFKAKIEDNMDQLLDLAANSLCNKTISDLEKPGARNLIRSELITVFNNALGGSLVQEIYITELAIQ